MKKQLQKSDRKKLYTYRFNYFPFSFHFLNKNLKYYLASKFRNRKTQ